MGSTCRIGNCLCGQSLIELYFTKRAVVYSWLITWAGSLNLLWDYCISTRGWCLRVIKYSRYDPAGYTMLYGGLWNPVTMALLANFHEPQL